MSNQPHLFCFGLGYTAGILAKQVLDAGWRVSGTSRSQDKCDEYRPLGITAHIFDQDLPLQVLHELASATHLLISIPPSEQGDIVLAQHLADIKKNKNLQWVGYFSTTGVYGDHGGEWVDENTPTSPTNDRLRRRVEAENAWLATGLPVHIFRLSGIYGPGRSILEHIKDGTARRIDKPGQVFSRIHVADIAQVVRASMTKPNPGSIYNCADDEPAPQAYVVAYGASLLGVPPPPLVPFEQADLSEMARSFYANNRRVSNQKIKEELGVELLYSNYQLGLEACLEEPYNSHKGGSAA